MTWIVESFPRTRRTFRDEAKARAEYRKQVKDVHAGENALVLLSEAPIFERPRLVDATRAPGLWLAAD